MKEVGIAKIAHKSAKIVQALQFANHALLSSTK